MNSVTILLSEAEAEQLRHRASDLGIPVEELAHAAVLELLTGDDQLFQDATSYVLSKNRELYERLG